MHWKYSNDTGEKKNNLLHFYGFFGLIELILLVKAKLSIASCFGIMESTLYPYWFGPLAERSGEKFWEKDHFERYSRLGSRMGHCSLALKIRPSNCPNWLIWPTYEQKLPFKRPQPQAVLTSSFIRGKRYIIKVKNTKAIILYKNHTKGGCTNHMGYF